MTAPATPTLSPHLRDLENESIHILREVAGQFDKIGLLFSSGKDSCVVFELARRAFATEGATLRLNAITHPAIRAESMRRLDAAEARGEVAAIYDMPLLVDLGLHEAMDLTVVVDVDPDERVRRLVASRGLDEADARARIARQIPDAVRNAAADVLIDNNGQIEDLGPQVEALAARLRTGK